MLGRAWVVGLAIAVLTMAALATAITGPARAERRQYGELVVFLKGGISPQRLPRGRPAPVAVHLSGGLGTADGSLLPRVTRIEIGLPAAGSLSTHGLPACTARRLRNAKPPKALAACRPSLVGRGSLEAKVVLPGQGPFTVHAGLLLFNARVDGRPAILLHAYATEPPIVVVLPFVLRHRRGTFANVLVADLPAALGPRPRLARFEMSLSRRYRYRGRSRSYLNASCSVPPAFTGGSFSLARSTYTLAGGQRPEVEIARGCRAI